MEQVVKEAKYLNNVITADYVWIYCYNTTFKQQTSEWVPQGSFHPLKLHAAISKMKCKVITFFYWEGLVYANTVLDSQSMQTGISKH